MALIHRYSTIDVHEVDAVIEELEGWVSFTGEESDEEREALLKTALSSQDYADLILLRELNVAAQAAVSAWACGETAINEEYFVEYTKELILDIYSDIPRGRANANDWPYRHIIVDYEAAAEELKQDYVSVNVGDTTWYIRG